MRACFWYNEPEVIRLSKEIDELIQNNRKAIRPIWGDLQKVDTPRKLNLERPVQFKPAKPGAKLIALGTNFSTITQKDFTECVKNRRSLRSYQDKPLTKEEVSYVLYETARVDSFKPNVTFRTIPTGGATNAMETYVFINSVDGIDKGLYHYIQTDHTLALIDDKEDIADRVNDALYHQLRGASIVVILTATPYRSEYKYSFCAHKMIAIEAGHAGQNLSLAAEVIDSGVCALAAYNQELLDDVLQIDGKEEFATYALTLGKK